MEISIIFQALLSGRIETKTKDKFFITNITICWCLHFHWEWLMLVLQTKTFIIRENPILCLFGFTNQHAGKYVVFFCFFFVFFFVFFFKVPDAVVQCIQNKTAKKPPLWRNAIYSWLSLSRPRLSRITAYLEVKIWSLLKNENLITGNKILWKRGEIAPQEQFLLFSTIFLTYV